MAIFDGGKRRREEDDEERIEELEKQIEQLQKDIKSRDLVLKATNYEVDDLTAQLKTCHDMIYETKMHLDVAQKFESYSRMNTYIKRLNPLFKLTGLLEQVTDKSELAPLIQSMNPEGFSHAIEIESDKTGLENPSAMKLRRDNLKKEWQMTSDEIQKHAATVFAEKFSDKKISNYFQLGRINGGYCVEAYIGFDDEILFIPEFYRNEPIVEVKEGLFLNCRTLKTLVIESQIKIIPKSFAEGCKVERVILPNTVNRIEVDAFQGSELRTIELGTGLQRIGEGAFRSSQLMEIDLPNTVSMIGKNAFADTNLQSIVLSAFLKVVNTELFEACAQLRQVVLNDGLERIESCAFRKKFLDLSKPMPPEIVIPNSVTFIEGEENTHTFRPFHKNTIIKCYPGSYAQQWAREHGYRVQNAEVQKAEEESTPVSQELPKVAQV